MRKWMEEGDNSLWLLTPEELTKVPEGTVLESITGSKKVYGTDRIDNDTRFGHLAYGVRNPFKHELKDIFLLMALTQ